MEQAKIRVGGLDWLSRITVKDILGNRLRDILGDQGSEKSYPYELLHEKKVDGERAHLWSERPPSKKLP